VKAHASIGVIGGSGLYEMVGLSDAEEVAVETPFGPPSDALILGTVGERRVAFLARHGRGHRLMPTDVNYRANIYAMKLLGVQRIFSASAVGSLREEIAPLHIVLPDQFVDRTRHRASTFFGEGLVAHISLADPFCPQLRGILAQRGRELGLTVHTAGVYLCIEGPQFSTKAESRQYRAMGLDIIGMTNATEARLAREAEICYATLALVTDYDVWHEEEAPVTVEQIVERLRLNARAARDLIAASIAGLTEERPCACGSALAGALITDPRAVDPDARERLRPIVGRYLESPAS